MPVEALAGAEAAVRRSRRRQREALGGVVAVVGVRLGRRVQPGGVRSADGATTWPASRSNAKYQALACRSWAIRRGSDKLRRAPLGAVDAERPEAGARVLDLLPAALGEGEHRAASGPAPRRSGGRDAASPARPSPAAGRAACARTCRAGSGGGSAGRSSSRSSTSAARIACSRIVGSRRLALATRLDVLPLERARARVGVQLGEGDERGRRDALVASFRRSGWSATRGAVRDGGCLPRLDAPTAGAGWPGDGARSREGRSRCVLSGGADAGSVGRAAVAGSVSGDHGGHPAHTPGRRRPQRRPVWPTPAHRHRRQRPPLSAARRAPSARRSRRAAVRRSSRWRSRRADRLSWSPPRRRSRGVRSARSVWLLRRSRIAFRLGGRPGIRERLPCCDRLRSRRLVGEPSVALLADRAVGDGHRLAASVGVRRGRVGPAGGALAAPDPDRPSAVSARRTAACVRRRRARRRRTSVAAG